MTTTNNLTATDNSSSTSKFFNNYFLPAFTVSQSIDDVVLTFFERLTGNTESAKILASSVIYTCLARNIDPIETISKFSSMAPEDLNSYMTMFLNLNRVGTSFLGVNNIPRVGKYVLRTLKP